MCRKIILLTALLLTLGMIGSHAQAQDSYIIVHALNPEGIEIGTIEPVGQFCAELFDGTDLFIGSSAYNAETHNVPIPIAPGTHTIRARFNGMTLEQGVNLEPGRTQILTFVFDRTEVSNVDLFTMPETTNSASGVKNDIYSYAYFWGDCMSSSPFYIHNITAFGSYSPSSKTGSMTVQGKWWCDPISVNVEGMASSTVTGEPSESRVASVQLRVDIVRHTPLQINIPYPVLFYTWYVQNNSAKVSEVWALLLSQNLWKGDLVEHLQTGYYVNGISAAIKWDTMGILPSQGPALIKEVTLPELEFAHEGTVEGSVSYTLTGETLKFSSVPYDLLGTGIHCGGGEEPPPENKPPVASFKSLNVMNLGHPEYEETSEGYHMVGGVIRFDASESYDPDPGGTIQSYHWDFAGGQFQRLPSPDQKPDIVFKEAKVYTITLVVVDNEGCESEPYVETLDLNLQEGDLIFIRTAGWTWPFDLVDNFYTHVGMYIGNQQMIESIVSSNDRSPTAGVVVTPLSGWAYPHETCAILVRLRITDSTTIPLAINFALKKSMQGQQYDTNISQKSLHQPNYYCSELLWAAYYTASHGDINLGERPVNGPLGKITPVWPDHIMNTIDDYGYVIAHHREFCPVYPPDYKPPHWYW